MKPRGGFPGGSSPGTERLPRPMWHRPSFVARPRYPAADQAGLSRRPDGFQGNPAIYHVPGETKPRQS